MFLEEQSADTREASATGTCRQPRSNPNLGTVGASERATVAAWEPSAGSQPTSLLGQAASQSLLQLLFLGRTVARCAGKSWLRMSGWGYGGGSRGGMGYGGRIADGDVHGDGFSG